MAFVALIYVGLVLIVNGLMLLGWLTPREAGPLNLFVGAMQVITPTWLIFTAAGDPDTIFLTGAGKSSTIIALVVARSLSAGTGPLGASHD